MARISAILIILSQLILIWLVLDTDGYRATLFSFVGHPVLTLGCVFALVVMWRRRADPRAVGDG
jgi:hypothetical protein